MDGLQRSSVSFRRQGSSGLVWDDNFLSGELTRLASQRKQDKKNINFKKEEIKAVGLKIERSRSNGGRSGFRTDDKISQAVEPPSPKVSACGFCGGSKKSSKRKTQGRQAPRSAKRARGVK